MTLSACLALTIICDSRDGQRRVELFAAVMTKRPDNVAELAVMLTVLITGVNHYRERAAMILPAKNRLI